MSLTEKNIHDLKAIIATYEANGAPETAKHFGIKKSSVAAGISFLRTIGVEVASLRGEGTARKSFDGDAAVKLFDAGLDSSAIAKHLHTRKSRVEEHLTSLGKRRLTPEEILASA